MGKKEKPAVIPQAAASQSPDQALKEFAKARGLRQPTITLAQLVKAQTAVAPVPAVADQETDQELDLKADFSPRQLRFLEIYFSPTPPGKKKISQEEALRRAGYKCKHQAARMTAKKILDKYCHRTDPREIFRRVGLSEEAIATRLLAIADDPTTPAGTRVQALSIASKCLGLQREVIESAGGARIVICGDDPEPDEAQQTGQQGGDRPTKPISIVR
ncbi:MAG: hypothetical protein QME78_00190 [Thermodesulfobacteriota bacterium]|nr:hypothetical protein [Thermodesulfobacteriota bacterium]